jgi:hypothetical protein
MVSGQPLRRPTGRRRSRIAFGDVIKRADRSLTWQFVEPMTGIEPAYSAWEADVLPLNYIGIVANEG